MIDGKIIYSRIALSYSILEPCNPYYSVFQCLTSGTRGLQGLRERGNECKRERTSTIWTVTGKEKTCRMPSIENRRNRWIKDKCQDTLEHMEFGPASRVQDSNWTAEGSGEFACLVHASDDRQYLHSFSIRLTSSSFPFYSPLFISTSSWGIAIRRKVISCPNSPIFRRTCFDHTSFSFILKGFSTNVRRLSARRRPNVTNTNHFGVFTGWSITSRSSDSNIFGQTMGFISHLQTLIGRNVYYPMAWGNSPS